MGVRCWNHVINSYSKLSCIFYSLTFGVDMKYMSMLDIWNQSFYVFLVRVGAATLLYTFVSLFASVLLLFVFFLTRTRVVLLSRGNESVYTPWMQHKKTKNSMVWYYRITFLKWHQKEASTSTWFTWWFKMPNKYECQILVPVDMNIVLI